MHRPKTHQVRRIADSRTQSPYAQHRAARRRKHSSGASFFKIVRKCAKLFGFML